MKNTRIIQNVTSNPEVGLPRERKKSNKKVRNKFGDKNSLKTGPKWDRKIFDHLDLLDIRPV